MSTYHVLDTFYRTHGSLNQKLVRVGQKSSQQLYTRTKFFLLEDEAGDKFFGKRPDSRSILDKELELLKPYESNSHVLTPVEIHPEYGMVSEYFEGLPFHRVPWSKIKNRQAWWKSLEKLVKELKASGTYNKIDIHASNILVRTDEELVVDWLLIDFEPIDGVARIRNREFLKRARNRINAGS